MPTYCKGGEKEDESEGWVLTNGDWVEGCDTSIPAPYPTLSEEDENSKLTYNPNNLNRLSEEGAWRSFWNPDFPTDDMKVVFCSWHKFSSTDPCIFEVACHFIDNQSGAYIGANKRMSVALAFCYDTTNIGEPFSKDPPEGGTGWYIWINDNQTENGKGEWRKMGSELPELDTWFIVGVHIILQKPSIKAAYVWEQHQTTKDYIPYVPDDEPVGTPLFQLSCEALNLCEKHSVARQKNLGVQVINL